MLYKFSPRCVCTVQRVCVDSVERFVSNLDDVMDVIPFSILYSST